MSQNGTDGVQRKQVRLRRFGFNKATEAPNDILKNLPTSTPKTIVLRKTRGSINGLVTKKNIIQENLKTLQANSQKKKLAQEFYYGESSQSPLTRTTSSNVEKKDPVHTRLGTKNQVRLRKVPIILNNNRIIKSKSRLLRQNAPVRHYSVQGRIQKIRQQQRLQQQGVIVGQAQFRSRPTNKVRLLRTRPLTPLKPTNFTVQVKNNSNINASENITSSFKHSLLRSLTPKLQAEIQFLQKHNINKEPLFIPCEPITVKGVGFTNVSLHERFSML